MEGLLKADIFFFVTTIAVVLVSLGLIVVIVYTVKILNNVKHISDKVREESDEIARDLRSLRVEVKKRGLKLRNVLDFFLSFLKPRKDGKSKKTKKEKINS